MRNWRKNIWKKKDNFKPLRKLMRISKIEESYKRNSKPNMKMSWNITNLKKFFRRNYTKNKESLRKSPMSNCLA